MGRHSLDAHPRRSRGVTLLELLIAVALVGILATIAYPSYVDVVVRNNRGVAKSALSELTSRQESYFVQNQQYASVITDLGYPSSPTGLRNNGGLIDLDDANADKGGMIYRLQVTSNSPVAYRVEAVPTGIQDNDSECGTLFITQTGQRGATGDGDDCW